MTFNDFNFDQSLIDGLQSMGYKLPTPIQQQAIPVIQQGKDLIACAQTGTGKTAAFAIPILQLLHAKKSTDRNLKRPIKALIVTPTRELYTNQRKFQCLRYKYRSKKYGSLRRCISESTNRCIKSRCRYSHRYAWTFVGFDSTKICSS